MAKWSMPQEVRHSVCALDCPDCCSLLINVENDHGSKLRGNPDHPITRGFLCGKVARYLEREYHPDRLIYPMKRTGPKGAGKFERVSWNEALDLTAERLSDASRRHGPESVLPYSYAGTMGVLNNASMDRRFFHRLGASRLHRSICAEAGTVGLTEALGKRFGTEPEQFRKSKLIIAWGANILGTNVHLWPFIVEARRQGAKFLVIDPIRTRTGAAADRWYGIQPGSDLALALGLMHVIFAEGLEDRSYLDQYTSGEAELLERVGEYTPQRVSGLTGLPAEDIADLARLYATTRPAAIRLNYGVQRSDRGAAAVRAIALLPAITGSWREEGGGLQLSTSQAFEFNAQALEMPELQFKSPLGREARLLNMTQLGRVLNGSVEPPVKALVVYNSNPGAIAPDSHAVRRGLAREDLFTVVLDHFQTDTADYADLLLPATTFLEHTDLYRAYGHYYVQLARPALPAPGEAKPNTEIFRLMAARMGWDEPCFRESADDLIRTALGSGSEFLHGITLQRLESEHFVRLNLPAVFQPFASGRPDGKRFDLATADLQYEPPVESRLGDAALATRFPLELVSAKHDDALNSTFGYRNEVVEDSRRVWLHRDDAGARSIGSGDQVRVFNDRGSLLCRAEVDGKVRPGVVRIPAVAWGKSSPDGLNVNVLTSQRLTDGGAGATFFSCLVQVEKCGD
ncbi:MAG TPA: molybdopterin-dependent oxidoreductase [Bryobacteraceae bacterium]|nr:molybdopterin-dependent oxidoreductase [Bryobacteraceae bacterium]